MICIRVTLSDNRDHVREDCAFFFFFLFAGWVISPAAEALQKDYVQRHKKINKKNIKKECLRTSL